MSEIKDFPVFIVCWNFCFLSFQVYVAIAVIARVSPQYFSRTISLVFGDGRYLL
jgi:hypothetical protein